MDSEINEDDRFEYCLFASIHFSFPKGEELFSQISILNKMRRQVVTQLILTMIEQTNKHALIATLPCNFED